MSVPSSSTTEEARDHSRRAATANWGSASALVAQNLISASLTYNAGTVVLSASIVEVAKGILRPLVDA